MCLLVQGGEGEGGTKRVHGKYNVAGAIMSWRVDGHSVAQHEETLQL